MNTEDYVSWELAKQLAKKGFNWKCDTYYDYQGKLCQYATTDVINRNTNGHGRQRKSAPTLNQAQKWLREVHDIHIVVHPYVVANNNTLYYRQIWHNIHDKPVDGCNKVNFKTYEEALSDALVKALELIEPNSVIKEDK